MLDGTILLLLLSYPVLILANILWVVFRVRAGVEEPADSEPEERQ